MKSFMFVSGLILILGCSLPSAAQEQTAIENQGFEIPSILNGAETGSQPETWFLFSSTPGTSMGITDKKRRSGMQSFFFKAQQEEGAYSGIAQVFKVMPGLRYEFTVYAINDANDPIVGDSFGQVSIEWKDETGQEIKRDYGPLWTFDLSPIRWRKFLVGANAPEEASTAQIVVTFFSRDAAGQGTCYIDDAKLTKKTIPAN